MSMDIEREKADALGKFCDEISRLETVCNQLRPGTGGAIRILVQDGFSEGWDACVQAYEAEAEKQHYRCRGCGEEYATGVECDLCPPSEAGRESHRE